MADISLIGAACFGLVVGWLTYRTVRRKASPVGLGDLTAVLGTIGGGLVTGVFGEPTLFGGYAIGLAGGFFGYFLAAIALDRAEARRPRGAAGPAVSDPSARTGSPSGWMGEAAQPPR